MEVAPDGSQVHVLLRVPGGSRAHFELAAGEVSRATVHRTVCEVWYALPGQGEMLCQQGEREEVVALEAGVCLTIPVGTSFQFRASATQSLCVFAAALPPWPGYQVPELWERG